MFGDYAGPSCFLLKGEQKVDDAGVGSGLSVLGALRVVPAWPLWPRSGVLVMNLEPTWGQGK